MSAQTKILFQQLAHLNLISPLWLEEIKSYDHDALLCSVALIVCEGQPGSSMILDL